MPNYDYVCECGTKFAIYQKFDDKKLDLCNKDNCDDKKPVKRLMGTPMILSDDIGRGQKRIKDKDLYKELDE